MAKLGRLFKFQDVVLLWEFPVQIFVHFKEVWILTYLFDGQIQKYFFDFYDVKYTKYMVAKDLDKYKLLDYDKNIDEDRIKFLKTKINIYDDTKLNVIGKDLNSLSYTQYKKSNTSIKEKIGLNIYNYFKTKDVNVNQELYRLSEMLQWIWRSRIRNNEDINIYIPSTRMRGLLIKYLDCRL